MWGYGNVATKTHKVANYFAALHNVSVKPVAVLPLDAASVEAMVDQMAYYIDLEISSIDNPILMKAAARAALDAIGIKGGAK